MESVQVLLRVLWVTGVPLDPLVRIRLDHQSTQYFGERHGSVYTKSAHYFDAALFENGNYNLSKAIAAHIFLTRRLQLKRSV